MISPGLARKLLLNNATSAPARARLQCGEHLMADLWISAYGSIQLPDPRLAGLMATVVYADSATAVDYTAAVRHGGLNGRLAVSLVVVDHLACLQLTQHGGGADGVLELCNQTGGDVEFCLVLDRTPFVLRCFVRGGGTGCIRWDDLTLSATVNGLTPPALAVRNWEDAFVIELASGQDGASPLLRRSSASSP